MTRRHRNNLRRMIDAHPEPKRLHMIEMTEQEAADHLNVSRAAIRCYEKRALKKLWALAEDEDFKRLLMMAAGRWM